MLRSRAPPLLLVLMALYWVVCCILGLLPASQAQTQPKTDPNEARALNSIFQKWRISADQTTWNISGELCSGDAIDNSISLNPGIGCDCTYNNNSICHIVNLTVDGQNVRGMIPDELWNLTHLTHLDLVRNYLTGPLSASIGKLTRLTFLRIGTNALSGELPNELGKLTDLRFFGIGINNFSGPLPSGLGNLTNLETTNIDSSGVSGEIPPTFANLVNLKIFVASDTELTGRIPTYIGNWSKLTQLVLQGNSFDGPIPSSFSNLTALEELRISDLTNGSSTLAFIKDMKNLTTLELRNNNISDSIPSNIGENQSLQHLDLSFNNIAGDIPYSLFNLDSLTLLFLGNNNLNGTLPEEKSTSLMSIDVSYNNLIGDLPTWIDEPNLQLNLVANNFTIGQNVGNLPDGLYCLQKNFPCNRGRGIYYNFSINCGGPEITSSDGIVYEKDNANISPASYYVTDTRRWGVSNVGYFAYKGPLSTQFTKAPISELSQTARVSASSLRYYGLGLENGNYSVTLQFAEIVISDGMTWQSVGRRIFDVYIQGNLVLKDFDIKREAGGRSNTTIDKQFKAPISENYLEIHLFWAGKGTCCTPDYGTYGPSISAIRATPDFIPTVSNNHPSQNRTGLIVGIAAGLGFVSIIVIFWIVRRRKRPSSDDDEVLLGMDVRPYTFGYAVLKTATENFSPANKLGEGGFGPVYKGQLNDGRFIAVKKLFVASRQGKSQFVAEIVAISAVQHRNLVKLYGCCIEGAERLLVYEYLENKSLDQALFGQRCLNLNWTTRYDICLGVARGLTYLHEESRLRIIHRDVKASNILLDSDLIPKISDFGLAKLYDDKKTHISTRVAGTIGYLSPEYALRGHLTEKTDVFAFGIVALEIVSGRSISDSSFDDEELYLLEWAWQLYENNREVELVDSRLLEFNENEAKVMIGVALLCAQSMPHQRPLMSRVVAMLCGDAEVNRVTSKPTYLTHCRFNEITSFTTDQDDQSSSYAASSSTVS